MIIDQFYAAWDKEDTSGKRGMNFNSQDLQRFKCSLMLNVDKKLRNCGQEFLHFVPVLVGYGTLYSCSFLMVISRHLNIVGGREMSGLVREKGGQVREMGG